MDQYSPILVMEDKTIEKIACGSHHTIIYKSTKEIFVFGKNNEGQLGIASGTTTKPVLLMKDTELKTMCCGWDHTFLLKKNGELLVFGVNDKGQLGLEQKNDRFTPVLLVQDEKIEAIACGFDHSMYLKRNGECFGFGWNSCGQLGVGSYESRHKLPVLIMRDDQIKTIFCSGNHSMILMRDGKLFTFGHGIYGQTGLGHVNSIRSPALVMQDDTLTLFPNLESEEWTPEKHSLFPSSFRECVFYFLLFLKRFQTEKDYSFPNI